jgi:hypothetical protein
LDPVAIGSQTPGDPEPNPAQSNGNFIFFGSETGVDFADFLLGIPSQYVGTQAHYLLALEEAHAGNPALCLQLSNPANLAPGQTPCGPFGESNLFTTASRQVINGTRGPLGPNFGSDHRDHHRQLELQLSASHSAAHQRTFALLAAHTYSKSLDQSSALGTPGDASRREFHGPGMGNFDMALLKNPPERSEVAPVPDRGVQRLQSRPVFWTAVCRRQYQQRDLRTSRQRGPFAPGSARREVCFLVRFCCCR